MMSLKSLCNIYQWILLLIFSCPCYIFAGWSQPDSLKGKTIVALAARDSIVFAGTVHSGLYRSTDNGMNWSKVNQLFFEVKFLAFYDTNLFAGIGSELFRTDDFGENWIKLNVDSIAAMNEFYSLIKKGDTILTGTRAGSIFRSTDDGQNWSEIYNNITAINSMALNGDTIYAATDCAYFEGKILRSINWGASWDTLELGPSGNDKKCFCSLESKGQIIFAGTRYGNNFRSVDNGLTWSIINNGLLNQYTGLPCRMINRFIIVDTIVLAAVNPGGIYALHDTTWIETNNGLPDFTVYSLEINNTTIFAGAQSGLFICPLSEIISIERRHPFEIHAQHLSVCPNPFNPITIISFSIPDKTHILFDIIGLKGIRVLKMNDKTLDRGEHTFIWDAKERPSGVYFCRLQANGLTQIKKLMLVK
jgi:photosystem II stability/assembly factor-like uncharacterized protein